MKTLNKKVFQIPKYIKKCMNIIISNNKLHYTYLITNKDT